jgi:hypothetical protein
LSILLTLSVHITGIFSFYLKLRSFVGEIMSRPLIGVIFDSTVVIAVIGAATYLTSNLETKMDAISTQLSNDRKLFMDQAAADRKLFLAQAAADHAQGHRLLNSIMQLQCHPHAPSPPEMYHTLPVTIPTIPVDTSAEEVMTS